MRTARCTGRFYQVSRPNTTDTRIVIARMRPLIHGEIDIDDPKLGVRTAQLDIAKRMVFSIPASYFELLAMRYGANRQPDGKITLFELNRVLNGENDMKDHLDGLLGTFDPIDSIRTSYYMHTAVIDQS